MDGLGDITVGYNSTGAGDTCEWFVTFTGAPGNINEVRRYTSDGVLQIYLLRAAMSADLKQPGPTCTLTILESDWRTGHMGNIT